MAIHLLEKFGSRLKVQSPPADMTYLHSAAASGDVKMVKLLLQRDKVTRNSALRAAALNGHEAVCQLLCT